MAILTTTWGLSSVDLFFEIRSQIKASLRLRLGVCSLTFSEHIQSISIFSMLLRSLDILDIVPALVYSLGR
jgi:hypothetical protein